MQESTNHASWEEDESIPRERVTSGAESFRRNGGGTTSSSAVGRDAVVFLPALLPRIAIPEFGIDVIERCMSSASRATIRVASNATLVIQLLRLHSESVLGTGIPSKMMKFCTNPWDIYRTDKKCFPRTSGLSRNAASTYDQCSEIDRFPMG